VKKEKKIQLDFAIDKLTNSIQNTISGDSFATEVSQLIKADLKQVTKKKGWNFNWKQELDNNIREVYTDWTNNIVQYRLSPHCTICLIPSAYTTVRFIKYWHIR
jgi:hypothetical protein